MKQTLFVLALTALGFGSCQKEELKPVTEQSSAPKLHVRLQAHTWQLLSLTDNGVPVSLDDCQTDDRQVFLDQNGYDDRGAIKCTSTDKQQSPFTYTILPDEQTISLTEGADNYHYLNVFCDDHTLRVTRIIQQDTLVISYQAL